MIGEPIPTLLFVYGHNYCLQSRMLAAALRQHNIEHEWRDVLTGPPRYRAELAKLARGYQSVPTVVFPDGTVLVGPWPDAVLDKVGIHRPSLVQRLRKWWQQ